MDRRKTYLNPYCLSYRYAIAGHGVIPEAGKEAFMRGKRLIVVKASFRRATRLTDCDALCILHASYEQISIVF